MALKFPKSPYVWAYKFNSATGKWKRFMIRREHLEEGMIEECPRCKEGPRDCKPGCTGRM